MDIDENKNDQELIVSRIPQRPPFLFVDKLVNRENNHIETEYFVSGKEDFLKGHFPGNPIVPGVILQEAAFQSGALLMSFLSDKNGLGVVSRVQDVKFKNFVKPGDLLEMQVSLSDQLDNAFYMKAKTKVNGKLVMSLSFTGTLVAQS